MQRWMAWSGWCWGTTLLVFACALLNVEATTLAHWQMAGLVVAMWIMGLVIGGCVAYGDWAAEQQREKNRLRAQKGVDS